MGMSLRRYISPEAATRGVIALIQEGDTISIEIFNQSLELKINSGEFVRHKRLGLGLQIGT